MPRTLVRVRVRAGVRVRVRARVRARVRQEKWLVRVGQHVRPSTSSLGVGQMVGAKHD